MAACNMTATTLLRSDMTKSGTTYYGGDAPSVPSSNDSFTESFSSSPLSSPWYDELSFTPSTNPDDASNAYSMTWGIGETGQNSGSTMRRLFEASDTFEIKCKFWCTAGFSGDNHMLHVLSSDAPIYAGSTAPYLINQIKVIDGNLRVNPAAADRSPHGLSTTQLA